MMRSTETWQGRPNLAAVVATAASIASGPHPKNMTSADVGPYASLRAGDATGLDAAALVEERDANRRAVAPAQDLENRKRTPEQRIVAVCRPDHDELPGSGCRGNCRRRHREHVVLGRQPVVGDHF